MKIWYQCYYISIDSFANQMYALWFIIYENMLHVNIINFTF